MDCSSTEGPTEMYAVYLDVELQIMIFEKNVPVVRESPACIKTIPRAERNSNVLNFVS